MAANPLVPFGFRLANLYGSASPNYALNDRQIAYNNTNKIAYGDPVKSLSTGYIDVMAVGGSTIHGVLFAADYPLSTAFGGYQFSPYWPGVALASSSSIVTAKVCNDPTAVFMAQVRGTALTVDNVGNNIDIYTGTSGAPTAAGISTCALDAASVNTTATLPFRIVGIVGLTSGNGGSTGAGPIPNYNPTYDNNFVYVKMNTSDLLNTTGI